jgi:hypothetical protein
LKLEDFESLGYSYEEMEKRLHQTYEEMETLLDQTKASLHKVRERLNFILYEEKTIKFTIIGSLKRIAVLTKEVVSFTEGLSKIKAKMAKMAEEKEKEIAKETGVDPVGGATIEALEKMLQAAKAAKAAQSAQTAGDVNEVD